MNKGKKLPQAKGTKGAKWDRDADATSREKARQAKKPAAKRKGK